MARQDKLAMLRELHGEEGFEEIENSHHLRINGQRAYVTDPTRELTIRHELIADLAATGLKPSQISAVMKTNGHKSDGGYYATLLRDPRIAARAKTGEVRELVDQAKDKLKGVVLKAAENIETAVNEGDIATSKYVLGSQGISEKPAQVNNTMNMDFGSWLSTVTNTKTMHNIQNPEEAEEAEVISDSTALPETTGHRL